ncbi:MAG: helicase RepA family protein, partial [Gammaproteobacteria bacterium]|nr:helicase RepA family protein [Gammaproteobacteria bacterium]
MTEEYVEQDILNCYDFLQHEKQTELRFINPNNPNEPARSLFVSTKEAFLQYCKTNNGQCNIYAGINERQEQGTKKEDVESIKTIVIDIDAIKPKGTAATEEELGKAEKVADKIITWFEEMGFAKPAKCMSGNGYQLWCAIPKIGIDGINRDVIETQAKAFYRLLIESFSGQGAQIDNIGDLPRIIKVIGTKSVKGEPTKERPHRISLSCNGFKRTEDQKLKDFILGLDAEKKQEPAPEKKELPKEQRPTLEQALADQKLADLFYGRIISQYQSRSEAEMALLCKLVWWGFSETEIRNIMRQSRIGKWADKSTAEHYQEWQLKKAFSFITETRKIQKDYPEEEVEEKIKEKPTITQSTFQLRTYLDFEKMKKDKRFLVEDLLYPKTVNMLFSPPAQFKSLLALHLAMQVATGKKFMGLKTKKYPVLLCDKENNDQIIKTRLQSLRKGQ